MKTPIRYTLALALAAAVSSFAASTVSAGPVANMWNSMFSPGYTTYYAPSYYPAPYTTYYAPTYAYGASYGGYGYAGYASCSPCTPCCDSSCSPCGSCGSCGGYGCSSCGSGNCVASAPSTKPVPDDGPERTFEGNDGTYDGRPAVPADPGDPGFGPRESDGDREALRPSGEESAIPMKKPAPTPAPAVGNEPTVSPLDLDDEFVWTAAPQRTRVKVHAGFSSPTLARTRVAPADGFETIPVSTRVATKK